MFKKYNKLKFQKALECFIIKEETDKCESYK